MAEDEPAGQGDPPEEPEDADAAAERSPPASATTGDGGSDSGSEDSRAEPAGVDSEPDEEADSRSGGPSDGPVDEEEQSSEGLDSRESDGIEATGSEDSDPGTDAGGERSLGPAVPMTPQGNVLPPKRHVEAPIGAVMQANRAERESGDDDIPDDVRKYQRFKKVDGAQYERVNEFLRERTYVTAREWAIARLCSDFRTETGIEMTKIGENLPHLVPFMTDTYTPQAVNQARSSFETKVRKSGATFLYGAMSDFFSADELDDIMYEVTEVAKFLLEVEGVDLAVDEELEGEERISSVMREVRSASDELRHEGTTCPNCGHEIGGESHEH